MGKYLIIGLGGFLGANARFLLSGWVGQRWGTAFPYGTFLINVTGCFVLGLFATLALRLAVADHWRLLIAVGFLGAYTTFSTFSYESIQLLAEGRQLRAFALNTVGSLVVGLLAAYLGIVLARWLLALAQRA